MTLNAYWAKSTDGGMNWDAFKISEPQLLFLDIYMIDSLGWISSRDGGSIFHTNDGGKHWVLQQTGCTWQTNRIDMINGSIGCIVGGGFSSATYFTLNGGEDWVVEYFINDPPWSLITLYGVHMIDSTSCFACEG